MPATKLPHTVLESDAKEPRGAKGPAVLDVRVTNFL